MHQIQRDLGRIESKVESHGEDIKAIRTDLGEIKEYITKQKGAKEWSWTSLMFVGSVGGILTHILNLWKPLSGS